METSGAFNAPWLIQVQHLTCFYEIKWSTRQNIPRSNRLMLKVVPKSWNCGLYIKVETMHWLDYFIFIAFLAASLGIGIYHSLTGGRQKTTQEFIMANRKLKVLPTMISLVASYRSAIMILGQTAEMYNWGIQAWVIGDLVWIASNILTERLIVPWIYPLKLTSSFEVNTFKHYVA